MTEERGWSPGVDGYEVRDLIGRGGFASVFRAVQIGVGRIVALKILDAHRASESDARLFRREIRAIGNLSGHPHIVTIHDAGETIDGRPWLSMEYAEAGTWGARVRADGPLAWTVVARIGAEVADALAAAHAAGIIHGDVKPDNVLIGPHDRSLLSDFGIAHLEGSTASVTATGSLRGSLGYLAPELFGEGRLSARTDLYALGATLDMLLRGRPAFVHPGDHLAAIIGRVATEAPPPLPTSVPEALRQQIEALLAKDPEDRPADAATVAARLSALCAAAAEDQVAAASDPIEQPHDASPTELIITPQSSQCERVEDDLEETICPLVSPGPQQIEDHESEPAHGGDETGPSTRSGRRRPKRRTIAACAAALVLLVGVAVVLLRNPEPAAAATVGDESIERDRLDDIASVASLARDRPSTADDSTVETGTLDAVIGLVASAQVARDRGLSHQSVSSEQATEVLEAHFDLYGLELTRRAHEAVDDDTWAWLRELATQRQALVRQLETEAEAPDSPLLEMAREAHESDSEYAVVCPFAILVEDEAEGAVRARLEQGESFQDISRDVTIDPDIAAASGRLGECHTRTTVDDQFVPELSAAVENLPTGQPSTSVSLDGGVVVIIQFGDPMSVGETFEDVIDVVVMALIGDRTPAEHLLHVAVSEHLRESSHVQVHPSIGRWQSRDLRTAPPEDD